MSAAWSGWLGLASLRRAETYLVSKRVIHMSANVQKKGSSKYAKWVMLNSRNKRSNERASKPSKSTATRAANKKAKSDKTKSSKALSKKVQPESVPKPEPTPVQTPPPKVVSFPRISARRAARPTSFLRGVDAERARTIRLEEFENGLGKDGERAGRLAASDISVESKLSF